MLLGIVSTAQVINQGWTPAQLFRDGTTGFWYNPTSFNNLSTTPNIVNSNVSAFDQGIGAVFDFSTGYSPTSYTTINEFTYSEDFTNVAWDKERMLVSPNDIAGPLVGTFGTKLTTASTPAGTESWVAQFSPRITGTSFTLSIYAKAGNVNRILLGSNRNSLDSDRARAIFDFSTQTWTGTSAIVSNSHTAIGDGWYRLSITFNPTSPTDRYSYFGPINNDGTTWTNITDGNYVYIYGAQIQRSSSVTTYIKTFSTAWPGNSAGQKTSTSRALVTAVYSNIQPSIPNSSQWTVSGTTLLTNSTIAPDGTNTATTVTEAAITSTHIVYKNVFASAPLRNSTRSVYRFSAYVKADTVNFVCLTCTIDGLNNNTFAAAVFDLNALTVTKTGQGSSINILYVGSGITSVGNGWVKIYLDALGSVQYLVSGAISRFSIGLANTGDPSFTADGYPGSYLGSTLNKIFVWNADSRIIGSIANLPDYQALTSDTVYSRTVYNSNVIYPQALSFDGSNDFYIADSANPAGGATTAFFFAAGIAPLAIGNLKQILFSDLNGNSGVEIFLTEYGELSLSVGNGTSITTITSFDRCTVLSRHVVMAWYDGVNIYVQIDNNPAVFTAFSSLSAGTSSVTLGKANGESINYYNGRMYAVLYNKNLVPTLDDINGSLAYCQRNNRSQFSVSTPSNAVVTQAPVYALIERPASALVTQLPVYINTKVDKRLYLTQAPIYVISIL